MQPPKSMKGMKSNQPIIPAFITVSLILLVIQHGTRASTRSSTQEEPPNVLLILIDDLRPELASYRTDGIRTPHIDRLANKGLKFNAAYCQYPVCNPSRSSLLTGWRPDTLGILSNRIPLRHKWPEITTLPQHFRQQGYFTAGLGKLFHQGTDPEGNPTLFRDDRSFDHYYKAKGREPRIGSQGEGRKLGDGTVRWAHWRAAEGGDLAQADGLLAAEAVRLLETRHEKPFFIGVGFHKPHDPFVAPKEYFADYPLESIQLANDPKNRTPLSRYALPNAYNFDTFTDRDRREFKRAYHACTTFIDAQVGKILASLDRMDLWENTIVVLAGDHGYHLGEHGWWNKVTVFDIGARVPLIVWVPSLKGMGKETTAVVELLDLYPTLIELCELKPPHPLQGRSLHPLLADPDRAWNHAAFTQVVRPKIGMGYSVRLGDWRLTQWGTAPTADLELHEVTRDREGYYNRINDPQLTNLTRTLHATLRNGYPQIEHRE